MAARIGAVSLVVVAGVGLLLIGAAMMFIALAWGPGQREALVTSEQRGIVPWFGLPAHGMLAAGLAVIWCRTPKHAMWPLLVAAISLALWMAGVALFV